MSRPRHAFLWAAPVLIWAVILAALALNVALSFAPLGRARVFLNFALAGGQVALMGLVFMRLDRATPLTRLTALAGGFWLVFLFAMSGADYFTRP